MLSALRKKMCPFLGALIFGLLVSLCIPAIAFPNQYPLDEESEAELQMILSSADQSLYPILSNLSPGALYLHGSTQMLIVMDPKTVQYLSIDNRQNLTRQAGACFLLAADRWEAQGNKDSSKLAKSAILALCMEAGTEVIGITELIRETSDWRSLSQALQKATDFGHLFQTSKEMRVATFNRVNEAVQSLEKPGPIAYLIKRGMKNWREGEWNGMVWGQRKLLYSVAIQLLTEGKWEHAATLMETAIEMYEPWQLPFMELELLALLRSIRMIQGETGLQKEAMERFELIANAYPNTWIWSTFSRLDQVESLKTNGDFETANTIFDLTESEVEAHTDMYEWEFLYCSLIALQVSNIWLDSGELNQAIHHLGKTISITQKIPSQANPLADYQLTITRSKYEYSMARLLFKSGRLEKGLTTFLISKQSLQEALDQAEDMPISKIERLLIKQVLGKSPEELFENPIMIEQTRMGILIGKTGDPNLGIQFLKEALATQSFADDSETSINTFLYLSRFLHEIDAPRDSITKYLTLAKKHIVQTDKNGYLTDLLLANSTLLQFPETGPDSSKIFLDSALVIAPKEKRREVILALGEYLMAQGQTLEAITWLQDSLPENGKFNDLSQGIKTYYLKGRCFEELGEFEKAKFTFQAGWNYFQSSTENQLGTISASSLANEVWPLVDGISRCFLTAGEVDSTLYWQEKIRTNFLSYLTTRYKTIPPGPERKLLTGFEKELAFLNMEIAQLGQHPDRLQKKAELITRIQSIRLELSPELIPPLSPSQIYNQLHPQELILQYAIAGDELWLITITQGGSQAISLGLYQPIDSLVSVWKNLASTYGQANQTPFDGSGKSREEVVLNNLYQALLAPISDVLLSDHPTIFIVPDGLLYEAPFAALYPASGDSQTPDFFTYEHTISWLPAASWISRRNQASVSLHKPGQVLILANSGEKLVTGTNLSSYGYNRGLHGPLRYTGYEAKAVASAFDADRTTLLIEEQASEDWIQIASQAQQLSNFDIIHFAGHVSIDLVHPSLSATLLEPAPSKGYDGFVDVFDWSNMDLAASLIVLSGCQSSLGEPLRGAGRLGFLQTLTRQGSAQVILSQWNVDDGSTALLFEHFYHNLIETNGDAASAMQLAQVQMTQSASRFASPYYWAAFQVFGVH